ncbi:replication protein RepA [Rhizobium beringeri]
MRLIVNAGELLSPRGEFVKQPLPYGSRARLLLLHLCSEAIRQQSPTIKIDASLTAFIKKMGFGANGGQRGNLIAFKQQLNALAACKMTIGTFDEKGGHTKTVNTAPFESMDVWFPDPSRPANALGEHHHVQPRVLRHPRQGTRYRSTSMRSARFRTRRARSTSTIGSATAATT